MEGAQDGPKRIPLIDELYPRPLPQTVGQHIEPCRVERPHDDRGRDAGQLVGQGEQLPVSQMGGKDEDSTVLGHRILEVFHSDEGDPRKYSLGWGGHRRAELDEHQTQMLERPAADSAAIGRRHLREGQPEVRHGQPSATCQRDEREITHPAAQPRRRPPGEAPDGGRDDGENQTDRRRRSRRISTPIGMTERTITTTTTMCT